MGYNCGIINPEPGLRELQENKKCDERTLALMSRGGKGGPSGPRLSLDAPQ
jgi:hypothetical protein